MTTKIDKKILGKWEYIYKEGRNKEGREHLLQCTYFYSWASHWQKHRRIIGQPPLGYPSSSEKLLVVFAGFEEFNTARVICLKESNSVRFTSINSSIQGLISLSSLFKKFPRTIGTVCGEGSLILVNLIIWDPVCHILCIRHPNTPNL